MALPAREVAHAALGGRSNPLTRIALGGAALTAWDLFLDPQMAAEGYWRWERPGRYRGIPLTNYVGWLATSLGLMAVLELLVPPRGRGDRALVGVYGWMAVMETVGFAAFFDDPLVAAVGGGGDGAARRGGGAAGVDRWLTSWSSAAGWAGWPPRSASGPPATPSASSSAAPRSGASSTCGCGTASPSTPGHPC